MPLSVVLAFPQTLRVRSQRSSARLAHRNCLHSETLRIHRSCRTPFGACLVFYVPFGTMNYSELAEHRQGDAGIFEGGTRSCPQAGFDSSMQTRRWTERWTCFGHVVTRGPLSPN